MKLKKNISTYIDGWGMRIRRYFKGCRVIGPKELRKEIRYHLHPIDDLPI